MLKQKKVAIFDSGVGGLTVYEKVKKIMPNENYIYFGDLKNVPYGEKTNEELFEFTDKIFRFFETKDVKAVIMACNTTSATVYDKLKDRYSFKIYPIIQSCANVIAQMPLKSVGVLATKATINSGFYGRELKKYTPSLEVYEIACPEWVGIVEQNTKNEPESVALIEKYVKEMLKNHPDKIILGCTHYPYLLDVMEKFAPRDMFIDPSKYFAKFIKEDLEKRKLLKEDGTAGFEKFYVSANPEGFKKAAAMFYTVDELPELID